MMYLFIYSYILLCTSVKFCPFLFFCLFRAVPVAHGGSQARSQIGATTAGYSHSHMGSKPHLQPTPQLTAMPDPFTHWVRPGTEPSSSGILVGFITPEPQQELHGKLSFIWSKMRTIALEAAFQIALKNHCKEVGGNVSIMSVYMWFWWRERYMQPTTHFTEVGS